MATLDEELAAWEALGRRLTSPEMTIPIHNSLTGDIFMLGCRVCGERWVMGKESRHQEGCPCLLAAALLKSAQPG